MGMAVEWFNGKIRYLDEINNQRDKEEELQMIEIKLKSLTSLELDNVATNIDTDRLFSHITSTSDKNIVEPLCNILSTLFEPLEPGLILQRYSQQLKQHLSQPQVAVKVVILRELQRTATVKIEQLLDDIDLVIAIIEKIGDDDLGVAKLAMDIVKKIGYNSNGLKALYSGKLLRTIAKLLAKNDAVSFRVYDVIIDISKSSDEALNASTNAGFLSSLMNVLESDDILLQLNALEAVGELAASDTGLKYLEERGILTEFNKKISDAQENPLSKLVIPGLMKFFGCVAKYHPDEFFAKYPVVISALFDVIEEAEDMVLLEHALDTLGFVASTVDGKYALESLSDAMPSAIKKIRTIIRNMPTDLRLRALDNFSLIIHVDKFKHNNRVLLLTKTWFDLLDDDPMTVIVNICKQPFPDIRQSGLRILLEMSEQPWGQEYVMNHPGLIEFLLNRDAEINKDCREIKYEIVKNLTTSDNLDGKTMQQLEKFVREGPFYVTVDVEVATEHAP